jgi:hypothetical protein
MTTERGPVAGQVPRGTQTGKREAEERNDPQAQPGAREGQPAVRERHERQQQAPDTE